MDQAEARAALWERYDAGTVPAEELEARLQLVDRAGQDEAALRAALDGPLPLRHRAAGHRTAVVVGAIALALVVGAGVVAAFGGDDGGGSPTATSGFGVGPETTFGPVAGVAVDVAVAPVPPGCPEQELPPAAGEAAANPALLTDPPFMPEGYELGDDDAIVPGADLDTTMSIAGGNPLPIEIRGRSLDGHLPVRMRTWRYADVDDADAAAVNVQQTACSYTPELFEVPDHPEITGSVIRGVIPTTAFAGWRMGDRRFLAAVEADSDDPEDIAQAQELAGAIAVAELDAARNPPPAPAP